MNKQTELVELLSGNTPEDMEDISQLLAAEGIAFSITRDITQFNPTFANVRPPGSIHLMVSADEIEAAQSLLVRHGIMTAQPDDSLRETFALFSDEELLDVLAKRHEWSGAQIEMAETLIAERGLTVSTEEVERRAEAVIEAYREPRKASIGYLVFAAILCVLSAPIGMLMGIYLAFFTGVDPNGEKYWIFDRNSRLLGFGLVGIGAVVWTGIILQTGAWGFWLGDVIPYYG